MDLTESGCSNLNLTLYQYYWDGTTWKKTQFKKQATTNSNGQYHFDGIPTYAEVGGKRYLAGYQLHLDALPDGNAVTVFANDNKLHWDNGEIRSMTSRKTVTARTSTMAVSGHSRTHPSADESGTMRIMTAI